MSKVKTQLVIEGKNSTKKAFDEVNANLSTMDKKLAAAGSAFRSAFSAALVTSAARHYATLADESNQVAARLRLAAKSQDEFNKSMADVRRVANENGASISAVTQLYSRLSPAMRDAGRSQEEVVQVTEAVTKALRISGATAAESEGALRQFAQALGAGALRGDEFNSIAEQAPRLMQALADSLGVNVGALKEMAKAGQLTSDVVSDALIEQLPTLAKEAEEFGTTIGAAGVQLENAAMDMVGAFDKMTGASARATKSMTDLAEAMNEISRGDNKLQGVADLMTEVARQVPQVAVSMTLAERIMQKLGIASKSTAADVDDIGAAAAKQQLQLDMIEKQEVDRNIRRLAEEERAAAELAGLKFDEVAALTSWTKAMGETYDGFIAREAERHRLRAAGEAAGQKMVQDARKGALAELQKNLKAQEDLVKAANKKLADARANTLKIEQEFQQLIADVRAGGGEQSNTYNDAQDAMLAARDAKRAGNNEQAINEARRAGEILKAMQAAGESSYGLEGMAQEIAAIANEAARLQEVDIEQQASAVSAKVETLKKEIEAIKVVSIDLQLDDASVEQLKGRMMALASELAQVMIIRPTIAGADGGAEPPAFATGGRVRGPGTGTSDSILARLSNGEFVMRAAAVKAYGPALLEKMNGLQIPRFAEGGLVDSVSSMPGPTPGRDLGRVDLNVGGESFSLLADGDQFDRILKQTARKFGRTRT